MRKPRGSLVQPFLLVFLLLTTLSLQGQVRGIPRVAVPAALHALLADEDTDGDTNITIDDPRLQGSTRGDRRFTLRSPDGGGFEVAGTYYLSNLLAVLKLAQEAGEDSVTLHRTDLFEPPIEHLCRAIRERYWQGLIRTVDEKGLTRLFQDEKKSASDDRNYVYVPHGDSIARAYFAAVARRHADWRMEVVTLPEKVSPDYVRRLDGRHGILSLALRRDSSGILEGVPFVVPGGRFNELYGWDSYFIVLGLLRDGRLSLAKGMVDNLVYEIRHYGKILNANRTYYLTRSQPPFLTSMTLAVYERLPRGQASREWLRDALEAAILEYENVWLAPEHMTGIGLSRYYDSGFGPPPEVEEGRFDTLFAQESRRQGKLPAAFREAYVTGALGSPELDRYFQNDRAMRESGHDASYRLIEKCADLATVDLNSLLYKTEMDVAGVLLREFKGSVSLAGRLQRSETWRDRGEKRRALMNRYLWDERRGMFFDYDAREGKRTEFESATTFYPLWAGLASASQASRVITAAIPLLAMPGGVAGSTERSRGPITASRPQTQWDYPFGWAPHQMIVWSGLQRYHQDRLASDLASRWLYMIVWNACAYNGTVVEKYDVADRSARVFAEYGNVGTKFSYITREGFGWTNASCLLARDLLSAQQRNAINRLIAPEWGVGDP